MISTLILRNFKCFESQTFDIGSITLLTGLNGMGKSSVLQALLLLRQSYLDRLLPEIGLELNGPLVRMGTAQDVLYEDAQTDEFELGILWDDGAAAKFVIQYNREADVLKIASSSLEHEVFTKAPFTDGFHYLQAERLGPRLTNAISDFQVREHRQVGSAGEYSQHFLQVHGNEVLCDRRLIHEESEPDNLLGQVQAWLHEISPGTELHLAMHSAMDLVNVRYSFVTGEQRSNQYRATSVGFGITYVLPVLVAVLSSSPGDIVLIENPEAHLHPKGQVRLAELLARAGAVGIQVIVETHSDHILNGLRLAVHGGIIKPESVCIYYFSRLPEVGRVRSNVESPVIDRDGRLDRWPDGFFDEWDKSLERLLTPNGS